MAPQIVWVSPTYQFALRHETIRISCIFSGRYFPSIFKLLFFHLVPVIFIYLFIYMFFTLQHIFSRSTTFLSAIGEVKPFASVKSRKQIGSCQKFLSIFFRLVGLVSFILEDDRPLDGKIIKGHSHHCYSPPPMVSWSREGAPLSPRMREESFGRELVISGIQFKDAGRYECQGSNEVGTVPIRRSFIIRVECKCCKY